MKFDTLLPIIIILFVKHVDCKKFRIVVSTEIIKYVSPKIYFRPQACIWHSKLGGDTSILAGAPVGIRKWAATVNLLQPYTAADSAHQVLKASDAPV